MKFGGGCMNKTFVIAAVVLSFIFPALSFSNTMDYVSYRPDNARLYYKGLYSQHKAHDKEPINIYSISYRNIKANSLILPEDDHYTHINIHGGKFNGLTSTYRAGQNIPHPLVTNVSIEPYFGDPDKSFKSEVFALPSNLGEIITMGTAFLTNMAAHEFGHAIVGEHVGATGNTVSFFDKQGGQFFFGMSSVKNIQSESKLPYTMGGEFFADLTFEHALKSYRKSPSFYNTSLMLYSGTDFLWYCFYAFYLSEGHSSFDPITVAKETGLSKDELFSIVLAKTMINTYRIYSGQDRVIPYFTINSSSAALNLSVPF
jgi:hypothetical protein